MREDAIRQRCGPRLIRGVADACAKCAESANRDISRPGGYRRKEPDEYARLSVNVADYRRSSGLNFAC